MGIRCKIHRGRIGRRAAVIKSEGNHCGSSVVDSEVIRIFIIGTNDLGRSGKKLDSNPEGLVPAFTKPGGREAGFGCFSPRSSVKGIFINKGNIGRMDKGIPGPGQIVGDDSRMSGFAKHPQRA